MDKPASLDEIVSHSAIVLADQIQKAAAWAKSEMDLQVEVAGALKDFARKAQITLEGHHNVTIATGRPDSVYGSVIVEYKDPNTLSPAKDAAPNQKLIEQLKKRFYDMRREEKRQWPSMFGVGTDGKYFVFLRFRDDKWTDQEPLEVNRHSTERFLWALYNLGQKGKPYQPEYLHGDFGSDSRIAQEGVGTLYDEILSTGNPRAQVFFNQWKILFGEVCGYDVENLSDKLKKLAEFYGVKGRPQPAQLLFALHTYYAILIKLLAAEIVSFFNPWMPRQVEKLLNATTSPKLKRELEELERGGIFHEMGITNFLEGDLFSWYLAVWSGPIETIARQMIAKLDEYNPGTFSEDPAQSRDLLKKLYQQLFPKSVRHDLGEYYTPDWLADHVLNELGYDGEGINLQFCHIVVNYDLPWNPMRYEQRIGRVYRYRQDKVVHIYNMKNRDTIEDTVRSYFDQRLRYAAEALGRVTGEDAEELIASLNGQLEAEIDPEEIYTRALVEGTLNKQSKEEIRQAVERAQEAYKIATTSLFRDISSYSFDSYQRDLASPVGLRDLEEFTLKFLGKERKQIQRKEGFLEFLTPESLRAKGLPERFRDVTFDRSTAIRNTQAEFFALGHPFVDAMLRHIGDYDFGGHTAARIIRAVEAREVTAGYQFNFTVRSRVSREDGDEYLFDFHTVVVRSDGTVDRKLAELAARSYSLDENTDQADLSQLEQIRVETAFESARDDLAKRIKVWDWDEEVELIGVAKVTFIPLGSPK